jgi:hypothetical protein
MKATRKNLNISIEYGSNKDAIKALQKLIFLMRQGRTRYERELINDSILEFAITNAEPLEYKEKIINGQFCHVFESKMNKELKASNRKK